MPTHEPDLFLHWLSERAAGTWDAAREGAAWLFAEVAPTDRPWMIAERLSDLGHLDLDWAAGRWSVPPPVINYLPPRSMLAVFCGSRTESLRSLIVDVADSDDG